MSMSWFSNATLSIPIRAPQAFVPADASDGVMAKTFALTELVGSEVGRVYNWNGSALPLTEGSDYTVSGNNVVLVATLTDTLIVMPAHKLAMNYGGSLSQLKTSTMPVWLARDSNFVYDSPNVWSEDLTLHGVVGEQEQIYEQQTITTVENQTMNDSSDVQQTGSLVSGIDALFVAHQLEGFGFILNGTYLGIIVANSSTQLLLNTEHTYGGQANADSCDIIPLGSLLFALGDESNTIPGDEFFVQVLPIPTLNGVTPSVQIWVRGTETIMADPVNIPTMAFVAVAIQSTE
jgi:hypothetical protein